MKITAKKNYTNQFFDSLSYTVPSASLVFSSDHSSCRERNVVVQLQNVYICSNIDCFYCTQPHSKVAVGEGVCQIENEECMYIKCNNTDVKPWRANVGLEGEMGE